VSKQLKPLHDRGCTCLFGQEGEDYESLLVECIEVLYDNISQTHCSCSRLLVLHVSAQNAPPWLPCLDSCWYFRPASIAEALLAMQFWRQVVSAAVSFGSLKVLKQSVAHASRKLFKKRVCMRASISCSVESIKFVFIITSL
jgi:hypothetical protein